ncbi:MAG: hypothetical protein KAH48_04900 [Chlorobi bacterium]|nr:hypothetical protein [Chlorobiota bacterium]
MLKSLTNILIIFIVIILSSCVQDPSSPAVISQSFGNGSGVMVLCEGLWGMNNSSLTIFSMDSDLVINDYYQQANPGRKLGDLASDLVVLGDTAFISSSSADKIIVIRISDGKHIADISTEVGDFPRKLCIFSSELGFWTNLKANSITAFNPTTFEIIQSNIKTGPAPEAIAVSSKYIFVANSGYGDFLADEPDAGTVGVYDINSFEKVTTIAGMPNVMELKYIPETDKLYACYYHLPSANDSLGGIVEIDGADLKILQEKRIDGSTMAVSRKLERVFFTNINGMYSFDLNNFDSPVEHLIQPINPGDIYYSIAVDELRDLLYPANARQYTTNGQIEVYNFSLLNEPLRRIDCGLNPNKIILIN